MNTNRSHRKGEWCKVQRCIDHEEFKYLNTKNIKPQNCMRPKNGKNLQVSKLSLGDALHALTVLIIAVSTHVSALCNYFILNCYYKGANRLPI